MTEQTLLLNKMDSFLQLFIFSAVMLFGSYVAGSVPLFMPMSENNLHLVSVMGAGLLVGVAFAVIVPEGIQTLIKAYQLKDNVLNGKFHALGITGSPRMAFWTPSLGM